VVDQSEEVLKLIQDCSEMAVKGGKTENIIGILDKLHKEGKITYM